MKRTLLVVALVLFISYLSFSQEKQKENSKAKQEQSINNKNKEILLEVAMSCANCEAKVKKQLSFEKGVKDVVTNLDAQTVKVIYDDTKTSPDVLTASVKTLGYDAKISNKACNKACHNAGKKASCCKNGHVQNISTQKQKANAKITPVSK